MPHAPHSTGTFIASLSSSERAILTDAQDRIRAQRCLGQSTDKTIELPLQWCEEAIALHRRGKATTSSLSKALDWALRNPQEVHSIEQVLASKGLVHAHERGELQRELEKHAASHEEWRNLYANDPKQAMQKATRAMLMSSRGLCNPAEINQVVTDFFAEHIPEPGLGPS